MLKRQERRGALFATTCIEGNPDPAQHAFHKGGVTCECGRMKKELSGKVVDTGAGQRFTGGKALPLPRMFVEDSPKPGTPRAAIVERREKMQRQLSQTEDIRSQDSILGWIDALDWVLTVIP